MGLFAEATGDVLVSDSRNNRIRKLFLQPDGSHIIDSIAGGNYGDGNPKTESSLAQPKDIWLSSNGDMYITDTEHHVVRKYDHNSGLMQTIAGNGKSESTDIYPGMHALDASMCEPWSVFEDNQYLYIGETSFSCGTGRVNRVDLITNIIEVFAGEGKAPEYGGIFPAIGEKASDVHFGWHINDIFCDSDGNIFIVSEAGRTGYVDGAVFKVDPNTNLILEVYGLGSDTPQEGALASGVNLHPMGGCLDLDGNLYICDYTSMKVWKIILKDDENPTNIGRLVHIGGDGNTAYSGDGGKAIDASFDGFWDIECDASGNLYMTAGGRIRIITPDGDINKIAGIHGGRGFEGDGGPALDAMFNDISGMFATPTGELFVCDSANNRVRMITSGNQAPVADAGHDQTVIVGEDVVLDGSASDDPDGEIELHVWAFGDNKPDEEGIVVIHRYKKSGEYTAELTVTDDKGTSTSDDAIITVISKKQSIEELMSDIKNLNLGAGMEKSLLSKLNNANESLEKGNTRAAINQLEAFINQINAQNGKKTTNNQADLLIQTANRIIAAIENGNDL